MSGKELSILDQRLSHGMTEADWIVLASAYDDWSDYLNTGNLKSAAHADLIFYNYGLMKDGEPDIEAYHKLIMHRC